MKTTHPMDEVVLVNENDERVGTMEKMEAHRRALLHRAFSVFIFNTRGEMLLQRRALSKYHSGGLWTNACCSHPRPGETALQAAGRRLSEELGFTTELQPAFTFLYRAEFDNGLTEHEFDHVFTGVHDGAVVPDPVEVDGYRYMGMRELRESMAADPAHYTEWFKIALPRLEQHMAAASGDRQR